MKSMDVSALEKRYVFAMLNSGSVYAIDIKG